MLPWGRQLPAVMPRDLVAHCLLVERPDGLTLVDTGIGVADVQQRAARLGRAFMLLVGPVLDPAETAAAQVSRLGFAPGDVTDIVLTHLDPDHSGGLADFPQATVHVGRAEHDAAMHPVLRERLRYLPAHWSHHPRWQTHDVAGESWQGFEAVTVLTDDILLVPLVGHTRGHSGVAVHGPDGWILHAGDAYFHHGEIEMHGTHCPLGLRLFQWMMEKNRPARLENQTRLRSLACTHGHEITMFCSHDPEELERLAGSSAKTPAEVMLMRFPEATRPDLQIVVGI
jgi:glyoxylase-like metal-dependent hydrolase (beta-lactamase superfamily II)